MARKTRRPDDRIGVLRGLLAHNPSEEVWSQLCATLDEVGEDALREIVLPFLLPQLDRAWPDTLRPAPLRWLRRLASDVPTPQARVAGCLTLSHNLAAVLRREAPGEDMHTLADLCQREELAGVRHVVLELSHLLDDAPLLRAPRWDTVRGLTLRLNHQEAHHVLRAAMSRSNHASPHASVWLEHLELQQGSVSRDTWRALEDIGMLRALHLHDCQIEQTDDAWVEALGGAQFSALEVLSITSAPDDTPPQDPLRMFAAPGALPSLRALHLRHVPIGCWPVEPLLQHPRLTALEQLTLRDAELDAGHVEPLLLRIAAHDAPALHTLDLSHNRRLSLTPHPDAGDTVQLPPQEHIHTLYLREVGAHELRTLRRTFPKLRALDFAFTQARFSYTEGGAITDLSPLRTLPLESLGLEGHRLDDASFAAFLNDPARRALRSLDLTYTATAARRTVWATLVNARHLDHLEALSLRNTDPDLADIDALARWSGVKRLHTLSLAENFLRSGLIPRLVRRWKRSDLQTLDLSQNSLGDEVAKTLAKHPAMTSLRVLLLGDNDLSDTGALVLLRSPKLKRLEVLSVHGYHLNLEPILAAPDLPRLFDLTHLDLGFWSRTGHEGVHPALYRRHVLRQVSPTRLREHPGAHIPWRTLRGDERDAPPREEVLESGLTAWEFAPVRP